MTFAYQSSNWNKPTISCIEAVIGERKKVRLHMQKDWSEESCMKVPYLIRIKLKKCHLPLSLKSWLTVMNVRIKIKRIMVVCHIAIG